ncbi:transglycosylase SLT domain-containing protein [Uliginosibacterium sp. H1]|uniref:transglycosylase SLT domain-containing protein n=1 Tax=Uliginosibacterium sp. H1 TaxID=3114757 RepID=UPI002E17B63A|nr:transglycosylase SLT domain-containing protein [Uliginosibacterium sp. H1]
MTGFVRIARYARYVGTFFVHFVHGGFVAAGVIVLALVTMQVSRHGMAGLSLDHFAPGRAIVSEEESGGDDVLAVSGSQLSPDLMRVAQHIARKYKVSTAALEPIVIEAQRVGHTHKIDPLLILAITSIESSFNPLAESPFGAQGLMQIVPRFHMDKISTDRGGLALFDPAENIRVGTLVLKEYMRTTGSLEAALQQYGGASEDASMSYSTKVLGEMQRLQAVRQTGAAKTTTAAASGKTVVALRSPG